jgi:TonB family protein
VQLPVVQEPGVTYEGLDAADGHVFVGLRGNGLGVYERDAANRLQRIGTATGLKDAVGVFAVGRTVYVADSLGGLGIVDATNPRQPRTLGRVATGGQARAVVVNGAIAYVGAGSAGLVVVDVSNPASPKVLTAVSMPGTAVRVAYSSNKVFVAAWNDARVYDVSRPDGPRFIGAVRMEETSGGDPVTARTLGIAGFGDTMFVGNWFVPYSSMSMRGHVVITFNVHKDGTITDLSVVGPCPIEAFNNAAFGALSGSNPTTPLPPEYPADKAFFTVTFFYNESPP